MSPVSPKKPRLGLCKASWGLGRGLRPSFILTRCHLVLKAKQRALGDALNSVLGAVRTSYCHPTSVGQKGKRWELLAA